MIFILNDDHLALPEAGGLSLNMSKGDIVFVIEYEPRTFGEQVRSLVLHHVFGLVRTYVRPERGKIIKL